MASYTYLTLSKSIEFTMEELTANSSEPVPFFEAKYGIPLFWLCLFDITHLKSISLKRDLDGKEVMVAYPCLVAPQEEALALAKKRQAVLPALLSEEQLALYGAFLERVEREFSPYIVVTTDDVADMDSPEDYAIHIREALQTMARQPAEAWLSNFSFENVSSLSFPITGENSFALVGFDLASNWPADQQPQQAHDKADTASGSGPAPSIQSSESSPEPDEAAKPSSRQGKRARKEEDELEDLIKDVVPQRCLMDLDNVRAQELLYTIQVALAVQKNNAICSSPKGMAAARRFLKLLSKRSHISHYGNSKLLAFDRSSKGRLWSYVTIGAMALSVICIGLSVWLHWLWLTGTLAGLLYWLYFPDPSITVFEFSNGYIRRGFKKRPFPEVTLADFTLTGKEEHLWASINLFSRSTHIIVLSGKHREKFMLAFFCALWRLMFSLKTSETQK